LYVFPKITLTAALKKQRFTLLMTSGFGKIVRTRKREDLFLP